MKLSKLQLGLGVLVVAAVAVSLLVFRQARTRRTGLDQTRRDGAELLTRLQAENKQLAQRLSQAGKSRSSDLDDLQRLRAEVAALREQTNAFASLEDENRRLFTLNERSSQNSGSLLETAENARVAAIARINYSREWVMAAMLYAAEHDDQFPENFEAAAGYLPEGARAETNLTTDQLEIVFHGSLRTITNPSTIIVIRERQARQAPDGSWSKAYGFADGHSEVHREISGDFDAWEKPRLIPPRNP